MSIVRRAHFVILLSLFVFGCEQAPEPVAGSTVASNEASDGSGIVFRTITPEEMAAERKAEDAVMQVPPKNLRQLGSIRLHDNDDPGNTGLEDMRSIALDNMGRLHVVAAGSDAMQVFDESGRTLWTGHFSRTFPGRVPGLMIKVTSRGDTWIESGHRSNPEIPFGPYVHFGPSGQLLGSEQIAFGGDSWWAWFPQPDGNLRWLIGKDKILLVDANGTLQRSIPWPVDAIFIERQDDNSAVAPDGSPAVVRERTMKGVRSLLTSKELHVGILSPRGNLVAEWPIPVQQYPQAIAFDGSHLALVVSDGLAHCAVIVTDARGGNPFRVPFVPNALVEKAFLLSRASGEELWVYGEEQVSRNGHGFRDKIVDRYALPQ